MDIQERSEPLSILERSESLKNAVATLVRTHRDHVLSREDEVGPKHPFYKASENLIEGFNGVLDKSKPPEASGDIPADCWKLFLAVWGNPGSEGRGGYMSAWKRYKDEQATILGGEDSWRVPNYVWAAYNELEAAMVREVRKLQQPRKPVAQLDAECARSEAAGGTGISDAQICHIRQKYTSNGQPDFEWLERVRANPELDTIQERMPKDLEKNRRAENWKRLAKLMAADPGLKKIREMLESGRSVSREGLQTLERQNEDLEYPYQVTEPFSAPNGGYDENRWPTAGTQEDGCEYPASEYTIEQQACLLLNQGIDKEDIKETLGISGQQLGAWERRKDEILAGLAETAGV